MNKNAKDKIGSLIEEFKIDPKILKTAGLASLGGMAGAGLDLYLTGHANMDAKDFIKPMAAWGLGGALGSLGGTTDVDKIKKV